MTGLRPLRPHQAQSLDGLRDALRSGKRRPVLQAPCGWGKTVVSAHIVAGARAKGNRVCFCVPSLSLIDQTFERFAENGIDPSDMGIIQASHPWSRPHAPIQIATAQTLTRRERPICDLVVIDEAHVGHKVYADWMADPAWAGKTFIGLTATPWAKGMGLRHDALIKSISLTRLIEDGYLSPFRVFAPSQPDLTGVRTVAGDYHEGDLAERSNTEELVADIVQTWRRLAAGRPTLCFAVDRAHARALHDRFAAAGVRAAYIDALTPREERDAIGRRLAAGDVQVVVNIGTLTTGIDWDVRCLILARPTKSRILFVQIVGRGLRTADGKSDCLILDHTGTHARLGFVNDIDQDELDDGKPRAKRDEDDGPPLPKCCRACTALMPAGTTACLACGHEMPKAFVPREAKGDLAELKPAAKGKRGKTLSVREHIAAMGKASVFGQLLTIQIERRRSSGWLAHAYRDVFGVWPRGLDGARPAPPSYELRQFVRSKDIRYAQSQSAKKTGAAHGAA